MNASPQLPPIMIAPIKGSQIQKGPKKKSSVAKPVKMAQTGIAFTTHNAKDKGLFPGTKKYGGGKKFVDK